MGLRHGFHDYHAYSSQKIDRVQKIGKKGLVSEEQIEFFDNTCLRFSDTVQFIFSLDQDIIPSDHEVSQDSLHRW